MDTNFALQSVGTASGLVGQYLINKQSVTGFYLFLLSNVACLTFQLMHQFWIFAGLYAVYFCMSLHGIYVWNGNSFFKPKASPDLGTAPNS